MKKIFVSIITLLLVIPFISVNAQTASEKITELSTTDTINLKTDDPDGNIRYVGANPNNYIMFNDELWRIIGVFDGYVKIIRSESMGSFPYDLSPENVNEGAGVNDWTSSDLMHELNGDYLNENLTSNVLWYSDPWHYNDGEFDYTKVMKKKSQKLVDLHTWNLGAIVDLDYTLDASGFYSSERGTNVSVCPDTSENSRCNDNIERPTIWQGKVGLPYFSDYIYSTDGGGSTDRNFCLNSTPWEWTDDISNIYRYCMKGTWMPNDIFITPIIYSESGSYVGSVGYYVASKIASAVSIIHPTVYLKSDAMILSGAGTKTNPYILAYEYDIDIENGNSNVSSSYNSLEVTINANEPEDGMQFDKWVVVEGNFTLDDATSGTTKFIMPAENVKLKATYKAIPVEYTILEGANQTYILNSNVDIVIKASGDLSKLSKIKVDNNELNSEDYELVSGSTILTLKSSYLNTLSIGNHTIEFLYNDGSVSTLLIVKQNNNETNNNTNTTTPIDNGEVKGATENLTNPKTGDNILLYISMLGLSLIGLAGTELYIRTKKFN